MQQLYQTQRAMRHIRRAAMQRGVVAILDVGTSKIACLVLRFTGQERVGAPDGVGSMAGQSSFRVIGAATTRSRGVRYGEVDAMQETERAIRTAVQSAQKMAATRVDHVIACISGARPRSYGLEGAVEIKGQAVTDQDIGRVLAACDLPDYGDGREVLHAHPVNFTLDHRPGLADPRGQIGNRLSTDLHLLTVDAAVLIFSEDDQVWYRGDLGSQPRDNVLIEYGLFLGRLGQPRVIFCVRGKPRIAQDLQGITFCNLSNTDHCRKPVSYTHLTLPTNREV